MFYYVYLLKSLKHDKSYVGLTSKEPKERLKEHNYHSNKWSKINGPFKLVYRDKFYCKKDAIMREKFLKSGQGNKLKKLILEYF